MNKEVQLFTNGELGLQVRAIKNNDGSVSVKVEDVAKGLGMIKRDIKNGKEYIRANIQGVKKHLASFGINISELSKEDYIHESTVYLLAMKAENESAKKFQRWLAVDVIPQIRRTGGYIPVQEGESEADILAKALRSIQTYASFFVVFKTKKNIFNKKIK